MALLSTSMGENFLLMASKTLSPAMLNSLRRVLISHVPTLGFEEFIQPTDYPALNAVFRLTLAKKRFTILDNTTPFSIPMLAHRFSRVPVFTSAQTLAKMKIGTPGTTLFFIIADSTDFTKPLINKTNQEIHLTAQHLRPVFLTLTDGGWRLDVEMSALINPVDFFPYKTFLLTLHPGQRLQALLRPVLGVGIDDPRYTPCVQRYRFNRDPGWQDTHPIKDIIHKRAGELSLRRQFSTKPPTPQSLTTEPVASSKPLANDVFMKPYEVELMVIQNGKMDQREAVVTALRFLSTSLAAFTHMIITQNTFIQKKCEAFAVTRYTVPQDTYCDAAHDPANRIYTGHTLANLIVSKMLAILVRDVISADISLLDQVLIAYKVPHPLIQQVIYTIQLPPEHPLFIGFFDRIAGVDMAEKLLVLATKELIQELAAMETCFN